MNWLIKLLGGYTRNEFDLLNVQLDSWRNRAISSETTVTLFKEILTRKEEREERILTTSGQLPQQAPPNMKPVGNSVSSWPRIRRELENQHRVKPNAQVSREEIEKTIRQGQPDPV